ncbi:hypothetical protein BpHYR1_038968 [Brachionus plicatilis]|uniref:Uncharacterized protein n=1 Tax=Brachionus plicatilis TaxID=10195 RepID=A0A3M7QB55_BRAPC|nr:hypothetical protein BpHYR1_038968 [Brachionus plicatilis]
MFYDNLIMYKMENYRKLPNPENHCTTISISRVIDPLKNQFPANFGRPFLDVSNQPKMLVGFYQKH